MRNKLTIMQTVFRFALGAGVLSSLTLLAPRASALEPAATAQRAQLAGGIRYGTENLNLGLGVRAGYTLDMNVYLGGMFDYFLGESQEFNALGATSSSSVSAWVLAGEGGYDFGVSRSVVIRPFMGIGIVHATVEACGGFLGGISTCVSGSDDDAVVSLGGLLHYVTGSLFLGPELRLMFFNDAALVIGGHVGGLF